MSSVTIVIPAHNALPLLTACLESCKRFVAAHHSILIIDDDSTDANFLTGLRACIADMPNVRLERNPVRLGFVQTCNRAVLELDTTDNDILLLNADTRVTEGFLEEMIACLALSDRHGACCPRSNNATFCTIPLFRSVPALASSAHFTCWQRLHPRLPRTTVLPTGVGFCLLIRRTLIRRFGLFDTRYGKGYHEENDFCLRINRAGFSVVLANHAFVFHHGGASFSHVERAALERRNAHLLHRRYPEYARSIRTYEAHPPAAEWFAELLGSCYEKRSVLFDLSHLPAAWNGTAEYALRLLRALHPLLVDRFDVFIGAHPQNDRLFRLSTTYPNVLMSDALVRRRFDAVFCPHQVFSMDHLCILNRIGLRWIVNVQDIIALRSSALYDPDAHTAVTRTLRHADGILSVSHTSLADVHAYFGPQAEAHAGQVQRAILHGYDADECASDDAVHPDTPAESFVFLVGNKFPHKVIEQALRHIPMTERVVVLGDRMRHTYRRDRVRFLTSGTLDPALIASLYRRASVVLFPSQYEGFGLPVLRAAQAGKHVIVCDTAVNRELRTAFGLDAHMLLFTRFEEIPALIAHAHALPPPGLPRSRPWATVAAETSAVLTEVLSASVDLRALEERFVLLSAFERKQHELRAARSGILARRMRRITSLVGMALTPFPRCKRLISVWAHRLRLLPCLPLLCSLVSPP